jgi:hypothetical protein
VGGDSCCNLLARWRGLSRRRTATHPGEGDNA